MYEQLNIDGDWITCDDDGTPHPKVRYIIEAKTKNHRYCLSDSVAFPVELEKLIAKAVQQAEHESDERVSCVRVYVDNLAAEPIATHKRLKKYREMKV